MSAIEIRPMQEQDCAAVSHVVCASFRRAAECAKVTEEQIDRYVSGRGAEKAIRNQFREYQCVVACADEQIIGMVGVQGNEVTKLYVDPHFHRQGVGALLLKAAEQIIRHGGHRELIAWIAFDSAIPFYEAMGMSAVGRKFDLFGAGEGGNTLLMKKPLSVHEVAKPQNGP